MAGLVGVAEGVAGGGLQVNISCLVGVATLALGGDKALGAGGALRGSLGFEFVTLLGEGMEGITGEVGRRGLFVG